MWRLWFGNWFQQRLLLGKITLVANTQSSQTSSKVDLSSLLGLHLFGEEGKVEAPKPKVVVNQNAPKTRLNVTLTGLVADSSDPISSTTSVAIIESKGGQNTYGIEDKISGTRASIYQIFVDRVILLVSGRYETLMLDGIEYSTKPPSYKTRERTVEPKAAVVDKAPPKKARQS